MMSEAIIAASMTQGQQAPLKQWPEKPQPEYHSSTVITEQLNQSLTELSRNTTVAVATEDATGLVVSLIRHNRVYDALQLLAEYIQQNKIIDTTAILVTCLTALLAPRRIQ